MGKYLLILLILLMPSCAASYMPAGSHYLDGSIIFLENTQPVVEWHTESSLTHVAILMNEGNVLWVYEATRPVVKKTPFPNWINEIRAMARRHVRNNNQVKAWVSQPDVPYTDAQIRAMKAYLESQLGRDYSIASYVYGPRHSIHCCELVSNTFNAAGFNYSVEPWRETPIKLWRKTGEKYGLALQPELSW